MIQVGDTAKIETTPEDFGRIAAQTAKQVILQRIREAERETLFALFSDREGEIVLGTVHNIDSQNITVNLGKLEAILPKTEQIPTERYRHNQKIRAYIAEVNKTSRGPQIILSRTHRNMLRRLFELEVPEIFNGLVEIKAMAREPGARSKIAVSAQQDGIDPVGACVGQRGIRIQAVVNELNGEKIDVVEWHSDPARFVANALSPAKVIAVNLGEDNNGDKVAGVVVEDKQLSLAIGKEGQNARLAAKLTGWRIDIKSQTQAAEEVLRQAEALAARLAALTEEERLAEAEAVRLAGMTEEERQAEALAARLAGMTEEERQAELHPAIVEPVAETVPVAAELVAVEIETVTAVVETETVVAEEKTEPVAAEPAIAEAVAAETSPETAQSFAEALAEFEDEDSGLSEEEILKKKADRRKRQTLVFDEALGRVVAKRKRKGGRQSDWGEEVE
jgi:N utilization substance protein A